MARDEERARAAAEVATRLRQRGIALTGAERPDERVDLLSAVERFEVVVEAHGGDLMAGRNRPRVRRQDRRGGGTTARPSAQARLRQSCHGAATLAASAYRHTLSACHKCRC